MVSGSNVKIMCPYCGIKIPKIVNIWNKEKRQLLFPKTKTDCCDPLKGKKNFESLNIFFIFCFQSGKTLVARTFIALKKSESPLNYNGTARINGKVVESTIRGPSYDVFYELSNYLNFDINMVQTSKFLSQAQGVVDQETDLVPLGQTGWTRYKDSFGFFEIGRFVC